MNASLSAEQRQSIVNDLINSGDSCIIMSADGVIHRFYQRGVKDLYSVLCEQPSLLDGAFVADKVVGKGAAALMCLGHVSGVYAGVLSQQALDLFAAHAVPVWYGTCVPYIINRKGDGMCPVEKLCEPCLTDCHKCFEQIEKFLLKA